MKCWKNRIHDFTVQPQDRITVWLSMSLRVRAKINSQILSVEAPAGQGAKAQESSAADSELSQHRQAGCIGA
jgi:hypothetical protein